MEKTFQYISDSPIGEDLFENKSQDKLADLLKKTIQNDNDCSVIGIEGGWGSGKSNVIKILEKKLNEAKDRKYLFFNFDVWAHQIDDYRKTILIDLAQFLKEANGEKNKSSIDWDKEVNKLLSHTKTTNSTSIPKLASGAIFLLIVTIVGIVLPPILDLFSPSLGEKASCLYKVLSFIPLFIVLLGSFALAISSKVKKGKWYESLFSLIKDNIESEERVEYILEKETLSYEFKNWLTNIDASLKDCILVIILDNIDRLPSEKVIQLWALVQALFLSSSEPKFNNIKVIIPFDRNQVVASLATEFAKSEEECVKMEPQEIATDYIDKTFDRTYSVPSPILSDWKAYFRTLFTKAINSEIDESVYKKIEQIVNVKYPDIRPRRLINFCNEVCTQNLLHDGENIGLEYISFYVAYKDEINKNPLEAINYERFSPLDKIRLFFEKEKYQQAITALVYQVNYDNAIDLIYSEKLRKALEMENIDDFNDISSLKVFPQLIGNLIYCVDSIHMESYVNTLDDFDSSTNSLPTYIWESIARQYIQNSNPVINKWTISCKIYKHICKNIKLKKELLYIEFSFFNDIKQVETLRNYVSAILTFAEIDDCVYGVLSEQFVSSEIFINCLKDGTIAEYKKLRITCNNDDFNTYLINSFPKLAVEDNLVYLKTYGEENDMSKFGVYVIGSLCNDISKVNRMFEILENISQLKLLLNKNTYDLNIYLSLLSNINNNMPWRYKYFAVGLLMYDSVANTGYKSYFNSDVATKCLHEITSYLYRLVDYKVPNLFRLTNLALHNTDLGKQTIKNIISENEEKLILSDIDKEEALVNYSKIKSRYSDSAEPFDLYGFVANKVDAIWLREYAKDKPSFIETIDLSLLQTVSEKSDSWGKLLCEKCRESVDNVDEKKFKEIMDKDAQREDFIKKLRLLNYEITNAEWSSIFEESIKEMYCNGKSLSEGYFTFYRLMKKDRARTDVFIKKITDYILNTRRECPHDIFLCFGADILDKYSPDERIEDFIIYMLGTSLFKQQDTKDILLDKYQNILSIVGVVPDTSCAISFLNNIEHEIPKDSELYVGLKKLIPDNKATEKV